MMASSRGSQPSWADSTRDCAPVILDGKAFVTTNPAASFHHAPGQSPKLLTAAQKALAVEADDKVVHDKWGGFSMKPTPRRIAAEQAAIVGFLKGNRWAQTVYAIDLKDGTEPYVPAALYTGGLHNSHPPVRRGTRWGGICGRWRRSYRCGITRGGSG